MSSFSNFSNGNCFVKRIKSNKKRFFNFFFHSHYRGSAIAKIVGANAARLSNFNDRVTMYVFEEMINGKKLTEIINETHENVKYLPGKKLPPNVVS